MLPKGFVMARRSTAIVLLALVAVSTAIRTPESFPHPQTTVPRQPRREKPRQQTHSASAIIARNTPRGGRIFGRKKAPVAAPEKKRPTLNKDAVAGVLVLTLIERAVNKIFVARGVKFPGQLGGCGLLFAFLVVSDIIKPGFGDAIFEYLLPGTALLTKWLPVFFVPGLAMLPLAPSVGSGLEVAKVLLVVCLGFVYTLYTVAFSVLFLRQMGGKIAPLRNRKTVVVGLSRAKPPFSDKTMSFLYKASAFLGIASVLAQRTTKDASWGTPLRTAFFYAATFTSYVRCARLPASFTKAVHPLLASAGVLWGILYAYGAATGSSGGFLASLKTYKTGSLAWNTAGAGDVLLFCLGPSVVSFAVSMYSRKFLLKEDFWFIVFAVLTSSAGCLFGTAAFANLIKLGGSSGNALLIRLSVLARNITTSLAIPVTTILGGDISIAVVVVVLTGIIGATYGRKLLDLVHIHDPVTRGLAVGSAAQGLGVSSMASETDAFPFAAMAMTLTAVVGSIFVSIPAVKDALVSICE